MKFSDKKNRQRLYLYTHISYISYTYPIHITLVVPSRQCLFTYLFSLPHPEVATTQFRAIDRETVYIQWRIASVTEPKFYAFCPTDGTSAVLAPNNNNLPEYIVHWSLSLGLWMLKTEAARYSLNQ